MKKFKTRDEIVEYLYTFRTKVTKEDLKRKFRFSQSFARKLGNPQNKIKVIHVAGTSGKGSTCAILSNLLMASSFRVGLSISPHLYDIRERIQISNQNISEEKFCKYFNQIYPAIEEMKDHRYGPPSFFEIMIVFAYYVFWKERVHYAVMETGQGGRLDATNIADNPNKLTIMTKIGLDHIDILGNTLRSITREKAAIIHEGNIVVKVKQRQTAQREMSARAKAMNTNLNIVQKNRNFSHLRASKGMLRFDFSYKQLDLKKIKLSLQGVYQVENASLALAALYELSKRDKFDLDENKIRETLLHMKAPARFEEFVFDGKRVVVDGAHNPQKMSAFIRSLKKKHPGKKFDFLTGFKKGKDYKEMLKYMVPVAHKIYVCEFDIDDQIDEVSVEPMSSVENVLNEKFNFTNVEKIKDTQQAFDKALKGSNGPVVITGSLYIISDLYKKIHGIIEKYQEEHKD